MTTLVPRPAHDHSVWRAWIHLAVLVVLAGMVDTVGTLSSGSGAGGEMQRALGHLPEFYFGVLPILVAISVGMLSFSRPTPRQALTMVLITVLLMLILDWMSGGGAVGGTKVGMGAGGVTTANRATDYTSVSLIRSLAALFAGDLVIPPTRLPQYGPGDPLVIAAYSVLKAGHLLLPVILVGVVLGVQGWIADHVTFRRPLDETVARVTLAWLFAPAVFVLAERWGLKLLYQVLFGNASLAALLLPFLALLVVGLVGWYTSWRVARWLE